MSTGFRATKAWYESQPHSFLFVILGRGCSFSEPLLLSKRKRAALTPEAVVGTVPFT